MSSVADEIPTSTEDAVVVVRSKQGESANGAKKKRSVTGNKRKQQEWPGGYTARSLEKYVLIIKR